MQGENPLTSERCTYGRKGRRRGWGEGVIANNEVRTKKKESHNFQHSADEEQSDQLTANH